MKEARHERLYIVWFLLYNISSKGKSIEMENESLVAEDWRLECNWLQMHTRNLFGSEGNILKLDWGDGCTTINLLKITQLPCIMGELSGMQITTR